MHFSILHESHKMVVLALGFNSSLVSWQGSILSYKSEFMSQPSVSLRQTLIVSSLCFMKNYDIVKIVFSGLQSLILFLSKMKWLCSTMYVKKLFTTILLFGSSLVVSISFFFFFFFFHYGLFYLLENAIEMKSKSKFTFQSEWFLPSANFVKFKVLKYLDIKVLASALCSTLVL